jgi:pimeloyl-ACP methyl ester carboxylesterase
MRDADKNDTRFVQLAEFDSIQLAYQEVGSGDPVVLIHGFPDTIATWSEIMPRVAAAGYRAIALQLPGYPPSSPLPDYGLVTVARALESAISALVSKPAHVVGYDWGAVSGYSLAALGGSHVRSLTAIGVVHPRFTPRSLDFVWRNRHILRFQFKSLTRRSLLRKDARYLDTLYRRWSPSWADPSQDVEIAHHMLADRAAVDSVTQNYRDMARGPTVRQDLRLAATPIRVPTLVLAGASDGSFRLDEFLPQERHFTGRYSFEVIEGGGHFLHREQPDALMRKLLPFLEAN